MELFNEYRKCFMCDGTGRFVYKRDVGWWIFKSEVNEPGTCRYCSGSGKESAVIE